MPERLLPVNQMKILERLSKDELRSESLFMKHPKWNTLCFLRLLALPTLKAAFIPLETTIQNIKSSVKSFAASLGLNRVMVRSDGGRESKQYKRGGNSLNITTAISVVSNFINSGGTHMGMIKEFKEFAMRGNVVDMAIGIVLGAAFGKIVSTFVSSVLMPPIGLLLGGVDFNQLIIILKEATEETEAVAISYGAFLNTVIDFIIIAFAIFLVVKAMNNMKKKEEEKPAPPPEPSKEEVLLTEIRDALKK